MSKDAPDRRAAISDRLASHPRSLIPERANAKGETRVALFAEMLTNQGASVDRAGTPLAAVEGLSDYLREHTLPPRLRMGADPWLAALPWDGAGLIERLSGPAEGADLVSVSRASAAAAETGTMFLLSGPDNPTTLNFLPETHIVLLREADLQGCYEDAWDQIRRAHPAGLPRTVNLISGPSRTADIEQTIILGAHGPRRLHVIVAGF